MIYSSDIQIPFVGCPINFTMPIDSAFYPYEAIYTPSLINNTLIQIRISQSLYESTSILSLLMTDRDGTERTFYFNKCKLSNGYYYANTFLLIGFTSRMANFKIYDNDELLADSNWYSINTQYQDSLKTINVTNDSNDFNTIFVESLDYLYISNSNSNFYAGNIQYDSENNKFTSNINSTIRGGVLIEVLDDNGIIKWSNFIVIAIDLVDFVVEIDETGILNNNCKIRFTLDDNIISESQLYIWGEKFTRNNTFSQDVECGFKPSGIKVSDEQNDFQNQNYVNNVVFSRPYTTKTLTIGEKLGIPTFIYQRLAYFFACSSIRVGSLSYNRAKDSDLELIEGTYDGLGFYKIDLQGQNTYSQTDDITGHIFDDTFNETFN